MIHREWFDSAKWSRMADFQPDMLPQLFLDNLPPDRNHFSSSSYNINEVFIGNSVLYTLTLNLLQIQYQ